jgi:hypothetical protein
MDNAIKAEWYDIEDSDREGFIDWLHNRHLPAQQALPGHIWIGHYNRAPAMGGKKNPPGHPSRIVTDDPTVGKGSQYLLVTAAPTADIFFNPIRSQRDAEADKWLLKRKGYRFAVFIEESRVNGPDWYRHMPGSGAPPAIQFGNYLTRDMADDIDLAYWYREMKLPQVTRARGCIGARKLISIAGWAKHGILYEFMEMDEDEENFEGRFREVGFNERWTGRHVLRIVIHAPKGPHAGRRIWPPVV